MPAYAGTIIGEVADVCGSRSLRGAEVTLVELNQSAAAGHDGAFRVVNIPPGNYTLRVRYPGTEEQIRTITVTEADIQVEHFALLLNWSI